MNDISVFSSDKFGNVRVAMKDGKPLFCGKDVCTALGYKDVVNAVKQHCRGVAFYHPIEDALGRAQEARFISEGDMYRLITHSHLPSAQEFESWVFDDVLPAIRKHGSYTRSLSQEEQEAKRMRAEAMLRNAKSREAALWATFASMLETPSHKQICAAYGTQVLTGGQMVLPLPQTERLYTASEVGKRYGISANAVGRIANEHNLKTPEYGALVWDKAAHSSKEVQSFRYNERGMQAVGTHLH